MRIWKFPLVVANEQTVRIPAGAQLLTVQTQFDRPQLWALCDTGELAEDRTIGIYGTGSPLPADPGQYIASFQMRGGELVFHAFEIK